MVKRFSKEHKKEKRSVRSGKNSSKISDKQIGSNYVSVFETIEDGTRVFTAKKDDIVFILRYEYGTDGHWNVGKIMCVEEDGTVKFWDQVLEQWFYFNWHAENVPNVLRKNV